MPNYRRYFAGQVISLSGNWMQNVTALWLVLSLTNSGVAVGLTTALQFLPMLLFGAYGGLLADRLPKRQLLFVTQTLMMIPALGLFPSPPSASRQPWMVYIAVFLFGAVNSVDNPTRQSFVIEMVGPDRLVNAVSLNSVIIEVARIVGPAIAGLLIAGFGVVPCFGLNLLTFVAMIVALWSMDPRALQAPPPAVRKPGAIREGLRYVRRTPELRGAAGADGAGRHLRLQLPGGAAAARQVQLRRRRRLLRGAGLGDGRRLDRRRARSTATAARPGEG